MVYLKSNEEIEIMAEGGHILARIFNELKKHIKPNEKTNVYDQIARDLCKKNGVKPAFLGYQPAGAEKPFPAAICASVNEVVVHGLPSDKELKDGDIFTVDMGIVYKDFYLDSAFTVAVGEPSRVNAKLLATTQEALQNGIAQARSGNTLGDIGSAIFNTVDKANFSIVEGLTGHGIGKSLHEPPQVLNFGAPGRGRVLEVGMVLAIEPMVSVGESEILHKDDDSFVTADGSVSAQFEHTVAITKDGPRILTKL